jgi:hypothetical protein
MMTTIMMTMAVMTRTVMIATKVEMVTLWAVGCRTPRALLERNEVNICIWNSTPLKGGRCGNASVDFVPHKLGTGGSTMQSIYIKQQRKRSFDFRDSLRLLVRPKTNNLSP